MFLRDRCMRCRKRRKLVRALARIVSETQCPPPAQTFSPHAAQAVPHFPMLRCGSPAHCQVDSGIIGPFFNLAKGEIRILRATASQNEGTVCSLAGPPWGPRPGAPRHLPAPLRSPLFFFSHAVKINRRDSWAWGPCATFEFPPLRAELYAKGNKTQ